MSAIAHCAPSCSLERCGGMRCGWDVWPYAQCEYLLSNPIVAAYVQCVSSSFLPENNFQTPVSFPRILSVDLDFKFAPEDLMMKFLDTLLGLPNLRRLELLSVRHGSLALIDHPAIFPNIESLITRYCICPFTFRAIQSYGAGLRRISWVYFGGGSGMFRESTGHRLQDRKLT